MIVALRFSRLQAASGGARRRYAPWLVVLTMCRLKLVGQSFEAGARTLAPAVDQARQEAMCSVAAPTTPGATLQAGTRGAETTSSALSGKSPSDPFFLSTEHTAHIS